MAEKNEKSKTGVQEQEETPKKTRFRDTWQGFAVFVAVLLALRFLVFEPFKIPTGSMEPTLLGHEDYGDRIVTNKLAYSGGTNPIPFMGGDPKRFDVFVFVHDSAWGEDQSQTKVANSLKRNYIKRVVGLPGETIVISGGDLFLREGGKERILRKWESSMALQESLWQPVSIADLRKLDPPTDANELQIKIHKQRQARAFPWDVNDTGNLVWVREPNAVRLAGATTLTYKHPVTNLYVKVGRWPFVHSNCPAADLPPLEHSSGLTFRDPDEKQDDIAPYLPNHWSGVECPNCGQIRFPMVRNKEVATRLAKLKQEVESKEGPKKEDVADEQGTSLKLPGIFPNTAKGALRSSTFWSSEPDFNASTGYFFYGGQKVVGDLKFEVELEVEKEDGSLELEVGSNRHRASWCFSLGAPCPKRESDASRHDVPGETKLSPGRKHLVSLAFVDGTVLSWLDGEKNEPLVVDVKPADRGAIMSLARIRVHGQAQVKITRLNLYRDLYYMLRRDEQDANDLNPVRRGTQHEAYRKYLDNSRKLRYEFEIPEDHFLALGDNSPSSVDSRSWGFVPRKNLVGRASFVFWPPSRWRIIR